MKLEVIRPQNIKNAFLYDDRIEFDYNLCGEIVEKIDPFIFKIKVKDRFFSFVHDYEFCAMSIWKEDFLFHNNKHLGFWNIPQHNSLFLEVSKNACSTVLSEIYNNYYCTDSSAKIQTNEWVWTKLSKEEQEKMNLSKDEFLNQSKDYKTIFLVYDNPIKRYVRMLNNKYSSQHSILSSLLRPYDDDVSTFISKAIIMTKINLLNDSSWDQHIVPIAQYHSEVIDFVTDFVPIEKLDNFMLDKFNIRNQHFYVSKERCITIESLNDKHIKEIEKIYKNDFDIPTKYADKFYK